MIDQDMVLLHQVHPVKLGADITASVLSNVLRWRHCLGPGLLVRFGMPVVGSVVVLCFGDVEKLRDTTAGSYVLANMPPSAVTVRLGG